MRRNQNSRNLETVKFKGPSSLATQMKTNK